MRPLNNKQMCTDDPCEALKQLIRNQSKKRREKCIEGVKQESDGAMYLDGEPAKRIEKITERRPRRIYDPVLPSRGPQLEPSMACYEKTNECKSHLKISRFTGCQCRGCACCCEASGPHCHTNRRSLDCVKDYCNFPNLEALEACAVGNAWSGDVYTDCKWPAPCLASCFDHRPPSDWHGQSRRQWD